MLTVTDGAKHDWGAMPLKEMAIGNAMDCDFTLRAWKILRSDMKSTGVNFVYENLLSEIAVLLSSVEFKGTKHSFDRLLSLLSSQDHSEYKIIGSHLVEELGVDHDQVMEDYLNSKE